MRFHLLTTAAVVAAALLAVSACKGDEKEEKPPPPPPAPAEPPKPIDTADPVAGPAPDSVTPEKKELAEKVLAHMEAIAAAGDSNLADCKQAAAAMKVAMDKAKADITEMEKLKNETPDKAARLWFERAYGARMMTVMGKVISVANRCKEDVDFKAAMADSPFARPVGSPPAPVPQP